MEQLKFLIRQEDKSKKLKIIHPSLNNIFNKKFNRNALKLRINIIYYRHINPLSCS